MGINEVDSQQLYHDRRDASRDRVDVEAQQPGDPTLSQPAIDYDHAAILQILDSLQGYACRISGACSATSVSLESTFANACEASEGDMSCRPYIRRWIRSWGGPKQGACSESTKSLRSLSSVGQALVKHSPDEVPTHVHNRSFFPLLSPPFI